MAAVRKGGVVMAREGREGERGGLALGWRGEKSRVRVGPARPHDYI